MKVIDMCPRSFKKSEARPHLVLIAHNVYLPRHFRDGDCETSILLKNNS